MVVVESRLGPSENEINLHSNPNLIRVMRGVRVTPFDWDAISSLIYQRLPKISDLPLKEVAGLALESHLVHCLKSAGYNTDVIANGIVVDPSSQFCLSYDHSHQPILSQVVEPEEGFKEYTIYTDTAAKNWARSLGKQVRTLTEFDALAEIDDLLVTFETKTGPKEATKKYCSAEHLYPIYSTLQLILPERRIGSAFLTVTGRDKPDLEIINGVVVSRIPITRPDFKALVARELSWLVREDQ